MKNMGDMPDGDSELGRLPASGVPRPVYEATRALFHVNMTGEALGVLTRTVRALGGEPVREGEAVDSDDLVEVSFGRGLRLRARAPKGTAARAEIAKYLPSLAQDAERILKVASGLEQLARTAEIDPVTGLPNHHSMSRLLSRLEGGDVIITISLDDARQAAVAPGVDEIALTFARALRHSIRASDYCFRMSEKDFLIIMRDSGTTAADKLLMRIQSLVERDPQTCVRFSAGIAVVAKGGWRTAVRAAGRAVRRVRSPGTIRWEIAVDSDYTDNGEGTDFGAAQSLEALESAATDPIVTHSNEVPEPSAAPEPAREEDVQNPPPDSGPAADEESEPVGPLSGRPRRRIIFPPRVSPPRTLPDKR